MSKKNFIKYNKTIMAMFNLWVKGNKRRTRSTVDVTVKLQNSRPIANNRSRSRIRIVPSLIYYRLTRS